MGKGEIVSEFARLNGKLGVDAWVSACVQYYNSGIGDRNSLQSQYQEKRSAAEADVTPILALIVRDSNGNGSINSLNTLDKNALELALQRLMRIDAAGAILTDTPDFITHACTCLGNGEGGVMAGCTAKGLLKKAELLQEKNLNSGVEVKGD